MSLITKIADAVTEFLLERTVPDIVEIGSHSMRRIRGELRKGTFFLHQFLSVPAPQPMAFSPSLKTAIFDVDAFKAGIEKLFPEKRRRASHVSIIFPDSLFHVGFLSLPSVVFKTGIQPIVEREVQSSAPLPLADYQICFEAGLGKGPKRNLLFCCLPQEAPQEIFQSFEELNLIPLTALPSFIPLLNLVKMSEGENPTHPTVAIHIGHETTMVAILFGGLIRRIQILQIGSVNFTKALARGLRITMEEAEALKKTEVILLEDPASDAQVEVGPYVLLEPLFTELLQKVYALLLLHSSEVPSEASYRRIILSGGGSLMRNLDKLITVNLGLHVIRTSQLFQGECSTGSLDPQTISEISPSLGGIALQPWRVKNFERMVA